nr:MAG TPA: hypothetical protein [Caudoviricetes sp.]
MTTRTVPIAIRGIEHATKGAKPEGLRRVTVKTATGSRSELLPSDPQEVARILTARRAKKTPAQRARESITAGLKKRGVCVG